MAQTPYEVLGTLADGPELTARVVRRPGEDTLYLMNRIPQGEKTQELFRGLYFYGANRPEHSEFETLFTEEKAFCALFRYHQGPSLKDRFPKPSGSPDRRLAILADAMFQVYTASRGMPLPVVCSMLRPENILLDENDAIALRWLLCPAAWADSAGGLWQAAAELMEFLMGKEVRNPHYRTLHAIYKKCRAGLYPSMAPLLHELQKAKASLGEADPLRRMKAFFLGQKSRLASTSRAGTVILMTCLAIYAVMELTKGGDAVPAAAVSAIGDISYVSAQQGDRSLTVDDPAPPPAEPERPVFASLPQPDAALDSEDYIVQSGETLESVCAKVYGAAGYEEAVAAFNGLPALQAEAGTVLRMPRRDQLALYMKNPGSEQEDP